MNGCHGNGRLHLKIGDILEMLHSRKNTEVACFVFNKNTSILSYFIAVNDDFLKLYQKTETVLCV